MDYGYPDKRKNKNDKRAKARYNRYKKGGKYRSTEVSDTSNKEDSGK